MMIVLIGRKSKTSHQDINDMGLRARKEGKKLIIFPEGTRNGAKGLSMLPFKKGRLSRLSALTCLGDTKLFIFAGAFHIAIDGKLPILPVVISEYDFLDSRFIIVHPSTDQLDQKLFNSQISVSGK